MEISFCRQKDTLNKFVLENGGSFLQSFDWGNFQEKAGKKVFGLQVLENKSLVATAQIIKNSLVFGSYFYVPYGPVFKNGLSKEQKSTLFTAIINKIKELAKQEKCFFVEIEPLEELVATSFVNKSTPARRIQPKKTLVLDIEKPEDELFKNFSRTTKYNIRLAEKKGVKIKRQKGYSEDFFSLMQQTKDRQDFGIHSQEYYKKMLELELGSLKSEIFFAECDNKIICATLMIFFGDTATTLHAGSDYKYRQIKGPNLLEWEIITSAKREGFKKIDFWGVDEKKWPGLTAFKKGFGGVEVDYPLGTDIVFNKFLYFLYKIIKLAKNKI